MTPTVLSETLVQVLGHSLWQATVLSALVWVTLRLLPARHAEWRYGVAVTGLVSIVLLAFTTWSILRLNDDVGPTRGDGAVAQQTTFPQDLSTAKQANSGQSQSPQRTVSSPSPFGLTREHKHTITQWLFIIWLCGVLMMLFRGIVGQVTVCAWLAESTAKTVDLVVLQNLVAELTQKIGLRRVARIVVSDRLPGPAVVGMIWPTILIPMTMLTGVPVEQWRIIIAHELAHVRRWDAIINLVQLVVESLLFFNPAVWWLSRQVRVEREACCDALAARVCGQSLSVARTLLDVACAIANVPSAAPAPALAFAEPSHEGELSDRVRRLVEPDRTPRAKVSWVGFSTVLITLVVTGIALHQGTDLAVRATAHWMSPKDRIDNLVQLEAEQNAIFIPPADGSTSVPSEGTTDADKNGKLPIEILVKTEDGADITPQLNLTATYVAGTSTTSMSLGTPTAAMTEYRKTWQFPPSQLVIGAFMPGYAAALSPPHALMPNSLPKTIELVLTKGTSIPVAIRSEDGKPIRNAFLQHGVALRLRGSGSTLDIRNLSGDDDGRLMLEHISDAKYGLVLQAPGYQRLEFPQEFRDRATYTVESPFVIKMARARPTTVKVINADSGAPVEQARIRIVHRQEQNNGHGYGFSRRWDKADRWTDYATTDGSGHAVLDQLKDNATYSFVVIAEGFGIGQFQATAGQPEQTVALRSPIKVSGRITGSLDRLRKPFDASQEGYQLDVSSRLNDHVNDNSWVKVDPEGRFETEGYSAGERLTFTLPDERRDIVLKESISNLELFIKPERGPTSVPMRDVVIRLTGTAPDAPARGTLYVSAQHPTLRMADMQNGPLPLKNNEIQLRLPVGAVLSVSERDLVGYRITEQNQIEIKSGSDPQVVDFPVIAAGGIHGTITRSDGSSADQAFVTVFTTKLPRQLKNARDINPSVTSAASQYLVKVPLGGKYRILVRENSSSGCVWTVTDEMSIDDSDPIQKMDIQLPAGRDLPIKVTDEWGQPVVGQSVELDVGFQMKSPESTLSFRLPGRTDSTGVATFRGISIDQDVRPIASTITAIASPQNFVGLSVPVEPRRAVEMRLKKGVRATGLLIDAETKRPIPGAEVRIIPRHFDQATFKDGIRTTTDTEGRFTFQGLEPMEYTGYVEGTSPKGTVIEPYGNGGFRLSYPAGVLQHSLMASPGGSTVEWEVLIHPNSKLRPLP